MKKVHGPAFKATPVDLIWCPVCKGKAVVMSIFHDLPCVQCHASGWVSAETGEALPVEVLVTQLGLLLNIYQQRILAFGNQDSGAQQQYEQNNRRGAGGSNFTGD